MSLLIKNVTVSDPDAATGGALSDILIRDGLIAAMGRDLNDEAARTVDGSGLYISPGWVDVMADYCDPGYEHRETIDSGLNAAAAGGFTDVFVVPNTRPAVSGKSVLEYILKKSSGHQVRLHVLGALSANIEGKELAEMMDMYTAGAVAFTDGWRPLQHAGLMLKALEYVKAFDGILIQVPVLSALAEGGLMNEGEMSVRLGMSGVPAIAESLMVQRDIELARYTGSRIHFSGISTAASLDLVRAAKKEGLDVTCSVTPYHLLFTDDMLGDYNSIYKVSPPLRTEADRQALLAALSDNTIDCIATHHRPHDWDAKVKEFEYAGTGMIGQETCFAMLRAAAPGIAMEQWARLLAVNPRRIFGLPEAGIRPGAEARFTLFDPEAEWVYGDGRQSAGMNSPWIGKTLKGKAIHWKNL